MIASLLSLLLRLPSRYVRAVSQAKLASERSKARFSDAIEALPDGFAIFDEKDRLVNFNQKYHDFFATEALPTMLGMSFEDLLRESVNAGVYELPDNEDGKVDRFYQDRITHHSDPSPNGLESKLFNQRWLRAVESHIPSGGTVIAYTDLTDLKKKEHELAAEKTSRRICQRRKVSFSRNR